VTLTDLQRRSGTAICAVLALILILAGCGLLEPESQHPA